MSVHRLLVKVGGLSFLINIFCNLHDCEIMEIYTYNNKNNNMNWSEKSKQIAVELLEEMEDGVINPPSREDFLQVLEQAAIKGMRYECDNWVLRRTK